MEARHLLEDIGLEDLPEKGFVLVLDQVTDPQYAGRHPAHGGGLRARRGIVTTERHSPALTGVLAKAASLGGPACADGVTVTNLARALEKLGDLGYLRVGLDLEGPKSLEEEVSLPPARSGARRRGQGPAPPVARELRRAGAHRHARLRSRA